MYGNYHTDEQGKGNNILKMGIMKYLWKKKKYFVAA